MYYERGNSISGKPGEFKKTHPVEISMKLKMQVHGNGGEGKFFLNIIKINIS